MQRLLALATGVALMGAGGCIDPLDPGELGTARHFGVVPGAVPLALMPPEVDREGNVYVLYGGRDVPEVIAFVGHAEGGWSTGCGVTAGNDPAVRNWVGATQDEAYYAAGTALVELRGDNGGCQRILAQDPRTQTELLFLGVVPAIHETESRDTVVALIQGASDRSPFVAVIDLDERVLGEVRPFEPSGAQGVRVLGVGADRELEQGIMLVEFEQGGGLTHELRFYDREGRARGAVGVPGDLSAARVAGGIHVSDGGLIAALLDDGRMLRASREGAELIDVTQMTPVGVHWHEGRLYLVGEQGGAPVVSPLRSDGAGLSPVEWGLSNAVASRLSSGVTVLDDRSSARTYVRWDGVDSAIGVHPFLSEHDPDDYAVDVTGWLIAGPSYQAGGFDYTAIAHVPIGLDYP